MENIQAFNAKSPVSEWAILTYVREYFARVKMFWDLWTFDDKAIRKNPASQAISSNDDKGGDSFTVVYRKPVNGYEVKAIVRPDEAIGGNDTVTVAEVVEWLNEDTFSVEAAAEWDSMNANGGYLPIRGAERYLDTIINHYHVVFIPEP